MGGEWERLALKWQFDHILITLFYIRWYKNFSSHLCIFDRGRERKYRRLKTEKLRYLAIRAFGGYDNETLQILRYHRGACR